MFNDRGGRLVDFIKGLTVREVEERVWFRWFGGGLGTCSTLAAAAAAVVAACLVVRAGLLISSVQKGI